MILRQDNFESEGRAATWRAFARSLARRLRPHAPWLCALLAGTILGRFGCGGCDGRSDPESPPPIDDILPPPPPAAVLPDLRTPVRAAPVAFPRNRKMPGPRETDASGAIDPATFSPGRDLVWVDDPRCWWESDHDGTADDECDHTMHAAIEIPFRRLVNLVEANEPGLQLRVQECYRPAGVHTPRSLHCEGRALDLTLGRPGSDKSLSGPEGAAALERLAKLAWRAGFDWVFNEWPRGGGPHVHASVRRNAPRLLPAPDGLPPH